MSTSTVEKTPIPATLLATLKSDPESSDFQFERADWTPFRSVGGLTQKAGVKGGLLRRLVLKELVDNALDAGGNTVCISRAGLDSYIVSDDGPGIAGEPDEIARLFSIRRPMMSSKLWRLPTRGALGNGLRVAVGSVAASDGALIVTTRNRRHVLTPRAGDGGTDVDTTEVNFPTGTKIEITFGDEIPADASAMSWANRAIELSRYGERYHGRQSPFWSDGDHFFELLRGAGERPVRDMVANLDGCSGSKAGKIAVDFLGMACNELTREQAIALLGAARLQARPVKPERLGYVGDVLDGAYAIKRGVATIGGRSPKADVPFVVEAWAVSGTDVDDIDIEMLINRTPITGQVWGHREKADAQIFGCGLRSKFKAPRGYYEVSINLTTPYCPITTDGKEPDLGPFRVEIEDAVQSAIRKAKHARPVERKRSQKDVVLDHLLETVDRVSGGLPFKQRQLLYQMRPIVMQELGVALTEGNFNSIITDYENENGEILNMQRDPRGNIMHPHRADRIPLGTETVSEYGRPTWNYNKLLYIEKEGFTEILNASQWLERHDCAIASTKGFPGRSIRDLIDKLAEHDEPLQVFCVHDADAPGTMIYQALQHETRARGTRLMEIIELGLDPWEAIDMGLQIEAVKYDRGQPVADYIMAREDGAHWKNWLQTHRVELNAMTTPQFIEWLDRKMEEHSTGKVIPPTEHVLSCIQDEAETIIRERLTERILREAGLDGKVAAAVKNLSLPVAEMIQSEVQDYFEENPTDSWKSWVLEKAMDAANDNEPEQQVS